MRKFVLLLPLFWSPSFAAITFVGEITGNYDTTVGTYNQSLASLSLQEGDIVVVAQSSDSSLASLGLDRDQGFTFEYSPADTSPGRLFAWKEMGATPDASLDFSDGSAYHTFVIQAYRGVAATASQPDVATPTEATGASTDPNSPQVTPSTSGAWVLTIAHMDDDDNTVSTTPTGYSNMSESNTGQSSTSVGATVAIASKAWTSGAEDPGAWTFSGADAWAANTFVLAPGAGGGGGTTVPIMVIKQRQHTQ